MAQEPTQEQLEQKLREQNPTKASTAPSNLQVYAQYRANTFASSIRAKNPRD